MKKGQKHIKITSYNLKLTPDKVEMDFSGLFPDNKQFADQITRTLRENTDILFEEFKGPFSKVFASIQTDLSNRVYSKIPMNNVFLE